MIYILVVLGCCIFFFQAEDGIRDLVRSRGLGDVYKRQRQTLTPVAGDMAGGVRAAVEQDAAAVARGSRDTRICADPATPSGSSGRPDPVSYTHLTLPTSDLV